jgi:CheY-like chemotaxis protein
MQGDPDGKDVSRDTGELVDEGAATGGENRVAARRVLVIDDEPTIRVALRRFFSRMGWEVSEAADGNAALSLLLAGPDKAGSSDVPFHMVLSDIRMPGLNGIQLYERLKAARPDIVERLVFSTGDVEGSETADFVRTVGCPVVQKPFMLAELKEIAERLTARAD